jgi:hypothetical protein
LQAQRVLRIRRWSEMKLRMPYPAMKPRANTGVTNSTSWIKETSRSQTGWLSCCSATKVRPSVFDECMGFMHCAMEQKAHRQAPSGCNIQMIKQNEKWVCSGHATDAGESTSS